MALRLREVTLELHEDESLLVAKTAAELRVKPACLKKFRVVRRGIDARKKPRVLRVYTVEFGVDDEQALLDRQSRNPRLTQAVDPEIPQARHLDCQHRALVVGMGPAGLFAALRLAQCGVAVTLVERGRPVEARVKDLRRLWTQGQFDPVSNVQFGEGGAGTFSDGKLTTRVNNPWMRLVLQVLVDFGAPPDILVQAKPHVGTDRLRLVLINFRRHLLSLGVDIRFETCLTGLHTEAGRVRAGMLDDQDEVPCDSLVLAVGHSARDTYAMLHQAGVQMTAKPFAMGVRIEHPATLINRIQYGQPEHPRLPTADYALTHNDPATGRGIYSFCMCPGGEVVLASSEPGGVVVNGMSYCSRGGERSNSALVVAVRPEDFDGSDPLAGVRFQRRWERAAFEAGGGSYRAPAQNLMTFLGRGSGQVSSSCRPGVVEADLRQMLPNFVYQGLQTALPQFDRRMRGFITNEATLVGVETRTSAPLRIPRGDSGESLSHSRLFPCGEGAGYAGGIMSAALDGLRIAEQIANQVSHGSGC